MGAPPGNGLAADIDIPEIISKDRMEAVKVVVDAEARIQGIPLWGDQVVEVLDPVRG